MPRRLPLARALSGALTALGLASACGDDAEAGFNPNATLPDAALCDTGFPGDCPHGKCEDAVAGEAHDGGTATDFDQASNQGTICTRPCSNAGDCASMSFASANDYQVASEEWSCGGGVCRVRLTPPSGGGDGCNEACLDTCTVGESCLALCC